MGRRYYSRENKLNSLIGMQTYQLLRILCEATKNCPFWTPAELTTALELEHFIALEKYHPMPGR